MAPPLALVPLVLLLPFAALPLPIVPLLSAGVFPAPLVAPAGAALELPAPAAAPMVGPAAFRLVPGALALMAPGTFPEVSTLAARVPGKPWPPPLVPAAAAAALPPVAACETPAGACPLGTAALLPACPVVFWLAEVCCSAACC